MYLIVGLGNPEEEYSCTRHNMGFNVINKISNEYKIDVTKTKFKGLYGSGEIEGKKVILLKPQTYMNASGESIREFIRFYKIDLNKLIIIYDDIDTQPGKISIRKTGTAGTHNGMKSVVENINTTNFTRIRIGIGMPEHKGDLINYVIGRITDSETKNILDEGTEKGKKALIEIIKNNVDIAMNKYNK